LLCCRAKRMVEPAAARPQLQLATPWTADERETVGDQATERRAHRRLTVAELSWLRHARIKYGPDVSLIDLSVGGAQIETTSYPPQPGSTVVIELAAGDRTWPVPARVLRCRLASLSPHATYRGAVAFKRPFDFEEIAGVVQHDVEVNPVSEYAKLNFALKRMAESTRAGASVLSAAGLRALESTLAMIESNRNRQSAAPFINEMGRLLRVITTSLDDAADPAAMVPEIITRLHRSVPSLMVRMVDASQASLIRNDAVYFRVPTEGIDAPECLVVEFPRDCALEAWHLKLLEAGAQLLAVSKDLALSRERSNGEPAPNVDVQRDVPELRGWNKLVVHYLDGRLLKGYGRDLQPTATTPMVQTNRASRFRSRTSKPSSSCRTSRGTQTTFRGRTPMIHLRAADGSRSLSSTERCFGVRRSATARMRQAFSSRRSTVLRTTPESSCWPGRYDTCSSTTHRIARRRSNL